MADVITKEALDGLYEACIHPPRVAWGTCPMCDGLGYIPEERLPDGTRLRRVDPCWYCGGRKEALILVDEKGNRV
ncbi:MAG: hypothetical protein WC683_08650 [bacterium]